MTNWKENGFVPDSDDDYKSESDDKTKFEGYENDTQDKEYQDLHEGHSNSRSVETIPINHNVNKNAVPLISEKSWVTESLLEGLDMENNIDFPTLDHASSHDKSPTRLVNHGIAKDASSFLPKKLKNKSTPSLEDFVESPKTPTNVTENQLSTLHSSPYSKVFKVPRKFWEENEDEKDPVEVTPSRTGLCMQDEVSKSYIQISSPISSILSSPPSTLSEYLSSEKPNLEVTSTKRQNSEVGLDMNNFLSPRLKEHNICQESTYPMRRALRQRNLIQLHPYMVEQEKYRQILKSRGIIPLRIVQSESHRNVRSRNLISPSNHTKNEYSQLEREKSMSQSSGQDLNTFFSLGSIEEIQNDLEVSPKSDLPSEGAVIQKARKSSQNHNSPSFGLQFLAENFNYEGNESDDSDDYIMNGVLREENLMEDMNQSLNSSEFSLTEEDTIDRMLPSRSRHSQIKPKDRTSKFNTGKVERQTRIITHLKRPRADCDVSKGFIKRIKHSKFNQADGKNQHRDPGIPQLSIVDVIDYSSELPSFIKIAARTARSKKNQGRHSPSRKFIRLSTFDDTQDAQAVLADWKGGKINPGVGSEISKEFKKKVVNQALEKRIFNNAKNQLYEESKGLNLKLRRYKVRSANVQQSMDDFVTNEKAIRVNDNSNRRQKSHRYGLIKRNRFQHSFLTRPAQLESSDHKFLRDSSHAFKLSKKKLDKLYAGSLRYPVERSNFQLNRFLRNKEVLGTIARESSDHQDYPSHQISSTCNVGKKKRPPKRLNAGAERYRQPSDPLVLKSINESNKDKIVDEGKLLGLGKLGTNYPIHFGVFPLQSGIFFQDSTYIGSGRLRDILYPNQCYSNISLEKTTLKVGERTFSWCSWNEKSASEMGVCFDLLSDFFLGIQLPNSSTTSAKDLILFVLNYIQQNISYHTTLDQHNFLLRMTQVLQEFSSRINIAVAQTMTDIEEKAFVLIMSSVLTLHLLQLARTNYKTSSLIFELEQLLMETSTQCISILLLDGLESLRRLYDDLQYHSYREAGISSKQITIEGWVIIIKVLCAASIPRRSFWDIVNDQLRLNTISTISDAAEMEKLWYSMYSLLPLFEFDDLGRVVSGQRHVVSFENWLLPTYLIKRVLRFYSSNPRQSSSFNEYVRCLIIRCHYLMIEWGWWKSFTLIGSVFDFFASQNLSHLRNEEVYHSPSFLEKLDTESPLDVEPEDCCFHIFLKIVALEFFHLRKIGDTKNIRNLCARLLPNHDRQYPKEQNIHQRDLASLRNHHDLLCTLFWSMPHDQRPSTNLIQGLVIADRSHREACMINLQSWENLTRFLVKSTVNSNLYQPFKNWQSAFFGGVYEQFLGAEEEVRQVAEETHQKSENLMTDGRIYEILTINKKNIVGILCRCVKAMGNIINTINSDSMLKEVLNIDVLSKALNLNLHKENQFSDLILTEIIQVLMHSMDQTEKLYPMISNESVHSNFVNEDSQDSIDINNWSRLEMISLLETLLNFIRPVIKLRLSGLSSKLLGDSTNIRLVDCWARLISLITENEDKKFQYNLILEANSVFKNRKSNCSINHYWPLFIAKLLYYRKSLDEFKFSGFDIGLEWLLSLADFEDASMPKISLTFQLHQKKHYLCKVPDSHKLDRGQLIHAAIREMSNLLNENSTEATIGIEKRQAKRYFSDILGEVMNFMQQILESLDPNSDRHRIYLNFARSVITNIKRYVSDFCSLTKFFIHPSAHYWPDESDPNLYAAGIVSYCIRLRQQPEKTSFELFYYLHSGWMNALITDRLNAYTRYIMKGMKCKEFTQFMLMEFIPAILEVGFRMNGWLLCSTFLPTISYRIRQLMNSPGPDSSWAFEYFLNFLKIMVNGTLFLLQKFPTKGDVRGAHPEHRGMLTVTYQFWMQNASTMRQYMERYTQMTETINQVTNLLSSFIYKALKSFETNKSSYTDTTTNQFFSSFLLSSKFENISTGKYYGRFIDFFAQEIHDCWQFSTPFSVIIRARSREISKEYLFEYTLQEVLQGEIAVYENLFECLDHDLKLKKRPNLMIEQLNF
ncbi:putative mus7 mms22 family protein [Erysiphe necator]|uniref:Putative mus7 mms22 family protein n=1 Tax=Uncinula necator TaxID=52586 RepID=A0A0B1P6B2_UNCNE|nr:putative mus7 mms22 family protein [Erysiphe necator]